MAATTLMIVDDDPDMRLLLRVITAMDADLTLTAEASDGEAALALWAELDPKPDVIVTDNQMPRAGGLELAARILQDAPDQLVVLFSAFIDDRLRRDAAELGVAQCVGKQRIIELPALIRDLVEARPHRTLP